LGPLVTRGIQWLAGPTCFPESLGILRPFEYSASKLTLFNLVCMFFKHSFSNSKCPRVSSSCSLLRLLMCSNRFAAALSYIYIYSTQFAFGFLDFDINLLFFFNFFSLATDLWSTMHCKVHVCVYVYIKCGWLTFG
jgi:hypothetical protein